MFDIGKFLGGCLTVLVFFLFSVIGTTLIGAFIGWVVGWFFGNTILNFFAAIGIEGFTMAQLGAVLGFVGGFFRGTSVNYNFPTVIKNDGKENTDREKHAGRGNF